ncbi:Uncharacterised protein [Mycobacteroides abscessus subsp. abscessus]|uniref:hypothetical protein n=1 Tax=Mycobacteroides abscessus TaxID=36809 RepID=UPI000925D005|nr:hypothetical protein [Mycobacteroides abscessus]SIK88111.1 Uncharacterised protein [Mycobacteroides abscessus subsp. abscessus]SLE22526.1 Uncharacterised protein [Mycobacteroides abscessus subsp. abscessus]
MIEIASNRLVQATYHYTGEWIADIVDKLNEIVDDTRWNEHVGNLPTFNQIVHVLDLTAEQGAAVGACREAAAQFDPYWAVLKQLMAVEGHSTGESREPSENLDLFFTLSDGTWGQATGAVPLMVGASQGTDSAREFRPLMPYIYPALVGAELNFATPDVASLRRSEVQGGGRPTQQYLSAALSGAY